MDELILTSERGLTTGPFELTKTGLSVEGEPTLDQWKAAGEFLHQAVGAVHWWIGDWLRIGGERYEHGQYKEAVEALPFEYGTLKHDKWVAGQIELCRRRHNLSWSHHAEVAPLPEEEQDKWLDRAEEDGWSSRQLRKAIAAAQGEPDTPPLPAGKYSLILADPPWRYEFCQSDTRKIENHYPTMEHEAICELDIQSLCGPDCVLFLWATSPKVGEAFKVIDAWGFTYKTQMIWRKDKIGMGYYVRQKHEALLIATFGSPSVPAEAVRPPSVIDGKRLEHSRKPEVFYDLIESMYPKAKKIELFSRKPRKGWKAWGNEV